MSARHPRAGLEGRPVILTATDDQVLDRLGAITLTLPGLPPARYVLSDLYLDAVDQWEAWHRTVAYINAIMAERIDSDLEIGDAFLRIRSLCLNAGLTREQGEAMNQIIEQAREGRLRIGPQE